MIIFLAGCPAHIQDAPHKEFYEHVLFSKAVYLKKDFKWMKRRKMLELKEVWRWIEGYRGYYKVSNLGRVKSVERTVASNYGSTQVRPGVILKQHPSDQGYMQLQLNKKRKGKQKLVHILVCRAFHGPKPSPLHEVNHKGSDGNKANNRWDNLEWATPKQNTDHAFKHGLRKMNAGMNGFDK